MARIESLNDSSDSDRGWAGKRNGMRCTIARTRSTVAERRKRLRALKRRHRSVSVQLPTRESDGGGGSGGRGAEDVLVNVAPTSGWSPVGGLALLGWLLFGCEGRMDGPPCLSAVSVASGTRADRSDGEEEEAVVAVEEAVEK